MKEPYLNSESGVSHYEVAITVTFKDGGSYIYNYEKPGKQDVDKLVEHAKSGKGLNTYITQHIKKNYFKKSL